MRRSVAFLLVFLLVLLLSGCSGSPAAPSSDAASQQSPGDPTTSDAPALTSKYGDFDLDHFNYGKKALDALDDYIDFKISKDEAFAVLTDLYNRKDELPSVAEDDPLFIGNDTIWAYVFLPYMDFEYPRDTLPQDIRDHRNLLAEALGLPVRDFSAFSSAQPDDTASSATDAPEQDDALSKYTAYLDGIIADAQSDGDGGVTLSYSIKDDGIYIWFNAPLFDDIMPNLDALPSDELQRLSDTALSFVVGDIGGPLYDKAVSFGCTQDVYVTISCRYGVVCSACNGKIIVNNLDK